MKSIVGLLVAAQVSLALAACGSSSTSSGSDTHPATASTTSHGHVPYEESKSAILNFGHAASPADQRAVTTLITRYYAAAAREDGATACSLLLASLVRVVPEDYGQAPGPTYLRGGKTCPAVMVKLFHHFHHKLAAEDAGLQVVRVRLSRKGGFAVMRFKTTPELHETNIVREGNGWKINSLLDTGVGR